MRTSALAADTDNSSENDLPVPQEQMIQAHRSFQNLVTAVYSTLSDFSEKHHIVGKRNQCRKPRRGRESPEAQF